MAGSNPNKRRKQRRANRELANFGKINWEAYSHPELYNMIMSANVQIMDAKAKEWREIARGIEETTQQVQTIVQTLMGSWKGSAAVASAAYHTGLTQWAGDASHTATQIAAGLANYTEAVEAAQHRMPSPVFAAAERNYNDDKGASMPGGPANAVFTDRLLTDYQPGFEKARENKAEAVRVMEDYESRSREVYNPLPQFEASPAMGPQPADPPRPAPAPMPMPPPHSPGGPPQGVPPTGSLEDGGSTTTSSATDPRFGPNGYPSGVGPGAPGPGGTDAYRGGSGLGPGGGFGAGPGGPGGAGGPGAGGPLAARGPGGAAAAGAAGMAGGRGFGGPGGAAGGGAFYPPMGAAGARGDEDKEHKNKYDKGLDLLDDLPPAYPPVFGV